LVFLLSYAGAREDRPNFIIILADDLGYGDVGFTGSTQIETPNIDSLARDGVILSQGYVSSPVCGPSRAGLISGRNQVNFGVDNNMSSGEPQFKRDYLGLPVEVKTIADYLGPLGYTNGLVGKWHLGEASQFHPLNRGFDEFWGYLGGGHHYFESKPNGSGYLSPIISSFKAPDPITYLTDDKGDVCVDFIRRHSDEPFFLFASFNAPHTPLQAPEADIERYAHIADPDRRVYCAMVHRLDLNVGKIVDELKAQGLYENTMIVFLSDNGGPVNPKDPWTNNAPFRGSKGILLEGGIRVPFVISWPSRLEGGATFDHPVSALDLAPTFFELAGGYMKPSYVFDGVNLFPYLSGRKTSAPHARMLWRFTISAGILEDPWKLIRLPDRLPLLYNLEADKGEREDVSGQHPERVAAMLKTLGDWDVTRPHPLYLEGERWRRAQLDLYDVEYQTTQP
jgi:arylsulfatase A-like enzyme